MIQILQINNHYLRGYVIILIEIKIQSFKYKLSYEKYCACNSKFTSSFQDVIVKVIFLIKYNTILYLYTYRPHGTLCRTQIY